MSLRTPQLEAKYQRARLAGRLTPLWDVEPIREFKHFKLIKNDYPHDRIARVNNMLIPKRRIRYWWQLRWYERRELKKIDRLLATRYHCIKRNYPALISVPEIVHWHLYILKEELT